MNKELLKIAQMEYIRQFEEWLSKKPKFEVSHRNRRSGQA
jgi:hypothetical protein